MDRRIFLKALGTVLLGAGLPKPLANLEPIPPPTPPKHTYGKNAQFFFEEDPLSEIGFDWEPDVDVFGEFTFSPPITLYSGDTLVLIPGGDPNYRIIRKGEVHDQED